MLIKNEYNGEDFLIDDGIHEAILIGFTPFTISMIFKSFSMLHLINPDFQDRFIEELSKEDIDFTFFRNELLNMVINNIIEYLELLGIKLSDDVDFNTSVHILEGVITLINTNDAATIEKFINDKEVSEFDACVNSINEFTDITLSELYLFINDIDNSFYILLLNKIKDDEDNNDMLINVVNDGAKLKNIVDSLLHLFGNKDLLAIRLIDDGVTPFYNFDDYVMFINKESYVDMERYIEDIFSVIVITKDGISNAVSIFNDASDILFNDINLITKMSGKINNYIRLFNLKYNELQNKNNQIINIELQNDELLGDIVDG